MICMGMYRGSGDGISVTAYTGNRAMLLAFDLALERVDGLAGFAVGCTPPIMPQRAGSCGGGPGVRCDDAGGVSQSIFGKTLINKKVSSKVQLNLFQDFYLFVIQGISCKFVENQDLILRDN